MNKKSNSLARIKLWLDVPYYVKLVGTEKKLDTLIIASGISEDDVISDFHSDTDIGRIFSIKHHTEITYTSKKTVYEKTPSGFENKEITTYNYVRGKNYSVALNRAWLNRRNPALATYGYILYIITNGAPNDFYVPYGDFSLYIPYEAYLRNDHKEVNKRILEGLKNVSECTRADIFEGKTPEQIFEGVVESDLYNKILKIK